MKLFYTPTSPFVRKVRIAAAEKGLEGRIELVPSPPRENSPALHAANPLGKIPALALDDGRCFFDSAVICEYLDTLSPHPILFPANADERLRARQTEALAGGIMEAVLSRFFELERSEQTRSALWIGRWESAARRGASAIESWIEAMPAAIDIGHVSLGAALGYLSLRFPESRWRDQNPKTARWFAEFSERPSMRETAPPA